MALALIAVEYEELPALFDPLAAMAAGALLLHPARGSNVVQALHVARGDPERGQAEADLVIEDPCTKGRLNDYQRPIWRNLLGDKDDLACRTLFHHI